jgi:hypothetical protein
LWNNTTPAQKGEKTMLNNPIVAWFVHLHQMGLPASESTTISEQLTIRPTLHQLAQAEASLPRFVQESTVAMRYLRLLGPLDWDNFPERDLHIYRYTPPVPYLPFVAACLVKLDQQITHLSKLREYLVEHPALIWVLGFPLIASSQFSWGFDAEASLPTQRHLTRMLRQAPNLCLQFLLDDTVHLLQAELGTEADDFGQAISLDTKVG